MRAPVVAILRWVVTTERIELADEDGRITMTQVMPTGLSAAVRPGFEFMSHAYTGEPGALVADAP